MSNPDVIYQGDTDTNGIPNGIGTERSNTYTYTGMWKDGKKEGNGLYIDKYGEFIGNFSNNTRNGWGCERKGNDPSFGMVKNALGMGVWLNGSLYEGTITYENGSKFEGLFKNNNFLCGKLTTNSIIKDGVWMFDKEKRVNKLVSGKIQYLLNSKGTIKCLTISQKCNNDVEVIKGNIVFKSGNTWEGYIRLRGYPTIEDVILLKGKKIYSSGRILQEEGEFYDRYNSIEMSSYVITNGLKKGVRMIKNTINNNIPLKSEGYWKSNMEFTGYVKSLYVNALKSGDNDKNNYIYYEGYINNLNKKNIWNGWGKLYNDLGVYVEGLFKNGDLHGHCYINYDLCAGIKDDHYSMTRFCDHIIHNRTHLFKFGEVTDVVHQRIKSFEGELSNNVYEGIGKVVFCTDISEIDNQDKEITGMWKNGMLNGLAKLSYTDGGSYIYNGEWMNNKAHGRGIYYLFGLYSAGYWEYGQRNGRFTVTDNSGKTIRIENWKNNSRLSFKRKLDDNEDGDEDGDENGNCHNPKMKKSKTINKELICPITMDIMKSPVICSDGNTYDRVAIMQWCKKNDYTSPITREKLDKNMFVVNRNIKRMIDEL